MNTFRKVEGTAFRSGRRTTSHGELPTPVKPQNPDLKYSNSAETWSWRPHRAEGKGGGMETELIVAPGTYVIKEQLGLLLRVKIGVAENREVFSKEDHCGSRGRARGSSDNRRGNSQGCDYRLDAGLQGRFSTSLKSLAMLRSQLDYACMYPQ